MKTPWSASGYIFVTGLPKSLQFPLAATPAPTRCAASLACVCGAGAQRFRLRSGLIRVWPRPPRFDGNEVIQHLHLQRPDQAQLFGMRPRALAPLALTELEVSRRVVEAPRACISRETRNKLLAAQDIYLQYLYAALMRQPGEAAALSEFGRLLAAAR